MRVVSGKLGVLVGSLLVACATEAPVVSPAQVSAPVAAPPPGPPPEPVAAPTPEPVVTPPPFDAATATSVRARIVAIPNRKQWVACGILHSVGALEVEVLDVGEPPPRMILFVSCPADRRSGPALVVGATLVFTLHARKQPWPGVRPLPELPRRYVAAIADQAAGGTL